jgi:divalent metal cation (Fe/Co/Zn/Cd) transporter
VWVVSRPQQNDTLRRLGLRLEYVTIAWNLFEGIAAITAGVVAHSIALTAFGLSSAVEVAASSVAAWQLRDPSAYRERIALRLLGACYLLVAAYVGVQSILYLIQRSRPESSMFGIVITAAAVVVMGALGISKRSVGRRMENRTLLQEATFSLVDAALSGTVLLGLVSFMVAGWWWADPLAALAVALFAFSEGVGGARAGAARAFE